MVNKPSFMLYTLNFSNLVFGLMDVLLPLPWPSPEDNLQSLLERTFNTLALEGERSSLVLVLLAVGLRLSSRLFVYTPLIAVCGTENIPEIKSEAYATKFEPCYI